MRSTDRNFILNRAAIQWPRRIGVSFGALEQRLRCSREVLRSCGARLPPMTAKKNFMLNRYEIQRRIARTKKKRLRLWFTWIRSGNARWRNKEFAVNQVNIAHWKFARVCLPCARGGAERSEAEGMLGTKKFLIKLGSWRFLCYIKHNDFCIFKYSIKNVTKS